ncbi:MAG: hypothetical protein HY016_12070, partial [Nitrosomonadales bacterium]|nr:hypothetical protein [Nitrosomonadales bacterium]
FLQFRLAGQKGMDATASRPPNRHYSKLHFILESAFVFKDRFQAGCGFVKIFIQKILSQIMLTIKNHLFQCAIGIQNRRIVSFLIQEEFGAFLNISA